MQQATLILHPAVTARYGRRCRPVETQAAPRVHADGAKFRRVALLSLAFAVLLAPLALVAISVILGGIEPITVLAAYILG